MLGYFTLFSFGMIFSVCSLCAVVYLKGGFQFTGMYTNTHTFFTLCATSYALMYTFFKLKTKTNRHKQTQQIWIDENDNWTFFMQWSPYCIQRILLWISGVNFWRISVCEKIALLLFSSIHILFYCLFECKNC